MILRFKHKLSIPTAAYPLVERVPLLEQLDQAITSKQVIALAALAGWGKTTVLAQWAARAALPVAWYTLDSTDRDPQLFLDYLLHAVAPYVPDSAELITQLANVTPQALPDMFRSTALVIAAAEIPFALVLDDYHTLEDDAITVLPGKELIFDLLATLAEYASNCHLIIVSRTLPNLRGIARLIAQRRAVFFDYAVLQWSAGEIHALVASNGDTISEAYAEQLAEHMNGWVTGIVLSLDQGVHVQDQPAHNPINDTSQVYAFFAEQIIAPLPCALQDFLAETSVLEDLSPQRCNALRGLHDSAASLAEITRRGLFVSHKGGSLSYHSLFRDFLRARLAQNPVREHELLLRAAELYRDEDDLERALDCYLAASAEKQAIDLLQLAIPRFRQRSRQNTLLACFEQLSGYFERIGKGRLLPSDLLLAQVRVYNDLALWERAELAIQLAETVGDDMVRWEAAILYAETTILRGAIAHAQTALESVPHAALPPRLQFEFHRTIGRVNILSGDIQQAITSLEVAQNLAPLAVDSTDIPIQLATIADNLGWAYGTQGEYQAALRYLRRADACWQASGNAWRRAITLNNLGDLSMKEGVYAEARRAFETGLHLAQQTAHPREELHLHYSMGELYIFEGQLDQAISHFHKTHVLATRTGITGSITAAAVSALWAAAVQGDAETIQAWQQLVASSAEPQQAEVYGRKALAESVIVLRQRDHSLGLLTDLQAQAASVESALQAPEQLYLALLRTVLAFEQTGSLPAEWHAFETLAASLPEPLVRSLVPLHRTLFASAAAVSTFAHHLVETTSLPTPIRWQISALGSFACLADGTACELSPLHRTLLVRLLDAGAAGLTVERLWEEVWGDTDIRMAALHKALARLREQTGLAMAARAGHGMIESPWAMIAYDVQAFEAAVGAAKNRHELERALQLYQGDFLPGAAPSAALWVDRRRSLLQQDYLDALDRLAALLEESQPKQAIQYYQRILQIDGCREDTATQLMRLAARQRNHALVNATFEQLESALKTLGATPEPATIALLHATTRQSR